MATLCCSIFSCKDQPDETVISTMEVGFEQSTEDGGPPPPGYTAPFKSIRQWLIHLAENDKADSIHTYNIGVFETEPTSQYILGLTGTKNFPDDSLIRIDYTPSIAFYDLKPAETKGKSKDDVYRYIESELKTFIADPLFKESFFGNATSIKTDWNGESIWTKQP